LRLGVALGEVRDRRGRFSVRGRRLAAVASGEADDLAGLVEELIVYDGGIYQQLEAHFRGASRSDYLDGVGDVIARASGLAEHVVGPFLATLVDRERPLTVLDVGCGSGVNLRWIAAASRQVQLTGIDTDPGALGHAEANIRDWALADRCRLEVADLAALPGDLRGPYDLVVLAQNIYYWPPEARADVMALARRHSTGSVIVLTATTGQLPFGRHLDLVLRVTKRNWRLPTIDELRSDATTAGLRDIDLYKLAPGIGMVALHARSPSDG
jgi:SAM-dependent methyltransferase